MQGNVDSILNGIQSPITKSFLVFKADDKVEGKLLKRGVERDKLIESALLEFATDPAPLVVYWLVDRKLNNY